jgi:hypothetical protein
MRDLGGAKHNFAVRLCQVDEARITVRDLNCKVHQFPQHFIQFQAGTDNFADLVQDLQ